MYLIVIAWLYVTVMMAIVEASSPQGSLLGALVTFTLYGLLPMGLLVYILGTPERKRSIKARQAAEQQAWLQTQTHAPTEDASSPPDASGHAPSRAEHPSVAPVREKM